jgi:hypothetical protein
MYIRKSPMSPRDERPISLNLSAPPAPQSVPEPEQLQFRRAEPVDRPAPSESPRCIACGQAISDEYFQAQGQVVCGSCAARIDAGQQASPKISLLRASLYGGGAALAGCALYTLVAIVTNIEAAIVAIAVGIMVGKAVRLGCNGLGGRPQQVLAVALTYLAITASFIPVSIYHLNRPRHAPSQQTSPQQTPTTQPGASTVAASPAPPLSFTGALVTLMAVALVSPFLGLFANPLSGLLSLFIIFIGLQRAWALTARSDILVMGPYRLTKTAALSP